MDQNWFAKDDTPPICFLSTVGMIKELFESLERNRASNAFCIANDFFTYSDLSCRVNAIVSTLRGSKMPRSKVVGIVSYDSINTYASILACWHEGHAYVPINPSNPSERNDLILRQSGAGLLLEANRPEASFLTEKMERIVTGELIDSETSHLKDFRCTKGQDLYVLFTSGSTGRPKGVPINEVNIDSFLDSYKALGISPSSEDRCLQMFDLSFDVSVASYLVPLMVGSCVYTVGQNGVKYLNVYKLLRSQRITYASLVPSIINYLRPYFRQVSLPDLRICILTAEASNVELIKEWSDCLPSCRLVNLYGPTEATIWCTGYFFDRQAPKSYNGMLIIGEPFKNVEARVCDDEHLELGAGVKGELLVSSPQLTVGYLDDPERSAASFVTLDGKRFYKTGDICMRDLDGQLHYCGRKDHQVKINGFRIELSEIEECFRSSYDSQCVVVAFSNVRGITELALFHEDTTMDGSGIADLLGDRLPAYMVPSHIHAVEKLPLSSSGKIDRQALVRMMRDE